MSGVVAHILSEPDSAGGQYHFRRVGRTDFVAYAPQTGHPSHAIPRNEDVGILSELFQTRTPFGPARITTISLSPEGIFETQDDQADEADATLEATYPLHHAIRAHGNSVNAIRNAYSQLPTLVRERDNHGLTPLHAAASATNLPALETLLSPPIVSDIAEDLQARDNIMGRTPLELCEYNMREAMECVERTPDAWKGHDLNALRVAFLLEQAGGSLGPLPEDAYVTARRWGCTCGNCTAGWLSARMQYRLMSKHGQTFVIKDTF